MLMMSPHKVRQPIGEPKTLIFVTRIICTPDVDIQIQITPTFGFDVIVETISTIHLDDPSVKDQLHVFIVLQRIRQQNAKHVVVENVPVLFEGASKFFSFLAVIDMILNDVALL
jgi:hypothetical protein